MTVYSLTIRRSRVLTNAVVETYLAHAVNREQTARLTRLEMLKKLYAQYDKELREKRLHLRTLSGDGTTDAKRWAMKQEFAQKQLSSLQGETAAGSSARCAKPKLNWN